MNISFISLNRHWVPPPPPKLENFGAKKSSAFLKYRETTMLSVRQEQNVSVGGKTKGQ